MNDSGAGRPATAATEVAPKRRRNHSSAASSMQKSATRPNTGNYAPKGKYRPPEGDLQAFAPNSPYLIDPK